MKKISELKVLTKKAQDIANRVVFTGFDGDVRTPLSGEEGEDKDDVIDFLNSVIDKQCVQILKVFTTIPMNDASQAIIEDIYEEGVLIRYVQHFVQQTSNNKSIITTQSTRQKKSLLKSINQHAQSKTIFVPFRTQKGRPIERLYLLAAEAQIKLGIFDDIVKMILPSEKDKNEFTVIKTEFVTEHMLRLHIKSDNTLPQNDPGFAYRFDIVSATPLSEADNLFSIKKLSKDLFSFSFDTWERIEVNSKRLPFAPALVQASKKYALSTALEVFKRIPEPKNKHKAQPVAAVVEKRYYTLRQLIGNSDEYLGEVDIYIHDDTPGSVWAKSLRAGDSIKVDNHYHETIKNMTVGQPLFICDETSMPSVAAVLERWQSDTAPIVISIANDQAEFAYFDDLTLPKQLKDKLDIQYIKTTSTDNLSATVINMIKQQNRHIDCAWGAIGKADFRPIKQYLRDEHGLKGKLNRIRAYWV